MNERIRELARQAGADVWGDEVATSRYFDLEKFAELILEECCKIMAEHSHRPAGVVKRNVKEHFNMNG